MRQSPVRELRPHQSAFVDIAYSSESEKVVLLVAPTGYGKTATLVAVIEELFVDVPEARVLLLMPAAFKDYVLDIMGDQNIPSFNFDQYWLRQSQDSSSENQWLPAGKVAVASPDFVRREDALEYITESKLDLLVADEVHIFRGERAQLLDRLITNADKSIFATIPPFDSEVSHRYQRATVVHWTEDDMVDKDGRPLMAEMNSIQVTPVPITPSDTETNIFLLVQSLTGLLHDHPDETWGLIGKLLDQEIESSPPALESTLISLRNRLAHSANSNANIPQDTIVTVETILNLLDSVEDDTKLAELGHLIDREFALGRVKNRILIVTQFVSTLHYLSSYLDERELEHSVLHSGQTLNERIDSVASLDQDAEILVASWASVTEHVKMDAVTALVAYDVPKNPKALDSITNLLRLERNNPVQMHIPKLSR
jgi:hypothetical protein